MIFLVVVITATTHDCGSTSFAPQRAETFMHGRREILHLHARAAARCLTGQLLLAVRAARERRVQIFVLCGRERKIFQTVGLVIKGDLKKQTHNLQSCFLTGCHLQL